MKLYSFYTESHKVFLNNWFLPSIKDDYEVISEEYPQVCLTGTYHTEGWNLAMLHKIDLIINAIKEEEGKVFVFSDVDVQFFKPTKEIILELIQKRDMIIQRDSSGGLLCAGFFAARANKKMLRLWEDIKCRLIKENPSDPYCQDDQPILNKLLTNNDLISRVGIKLPITNRSFFPNPYVIKWSYLPNIFFTHGVITGKRWEPGDTFDIPKGIITHHANWTVGIENKIALLKYVKGLAKERLLRI